MKKSTFDFVRETGRDKIWKAINRELRDVLDEKGMLRKELRRYVRCALCDVDDAEPVFTKQGFRFVMCRRCGLIYVNPQKKTGELQYRDEARRSYDLWVGMVLQSRAEREYDAKKFSGMCRDLERLTGSRGRVLDIGCSLGHFLEIARSRGWDTVGLEFNRKAVRHATRVLGLDVRAVALSDAGFKPGSFDAVTLWEVLEHVSDPGKLLQECARYIRPGGVLGVLVPNRNALSAMIMHERCSCFGGRDHLWHFSRDTLSRLLKKTGFTEIRGETRTQLSQVNEILGHLSYRDPYNSPPGKHDFRLAKKTREKLERFIFDHHLGYKLLMYAERD
ncbi:MAG: class I SAM-dependent methyltransferase [bacterium]